MVALNRLKAFLTEDEISKVLQSYSIGVDHFNWKVLGIQAFPHFRDQIQGFDNDVHTGVIQAKKAIDDVEF